MQNSIHTMRAGFRKTPLFLLAQWAAFLLLILASTLAQPITLTAVQSRKAHGVVGTLDVAIDTTKSIDGAVTVESRTIGASHQIVFKFDGPITAPGTAAATDANGAIVGSASSMVDGNDVVVTLSALADNSRITVWLTNVNGTGLYVSAAVGFLVGDTNNSRSINNTDASAVKARAGQVAGAANA